MLKLSAFTNWTLKQNNVFLSRTVRWRVQITPRGCGAICHRPLLRLASISTSSRDRHTTVVERWWCCLLSCLETSEGTLVEGAVYSTSHEVHGTLTAIAPSWVNLQAVLLVEVHRMCRSWILHWSYLFIVGVLILLHQRFVVLAYGHWRVCHAIVVLVELGPLAPVLSWRLEDENSWLTEDIRAGRGTGTTDGHMKARKRCVDHWALSFCRTGSASPNV